VHRKSRCNSLANRVNCVEKGFTEKKMCKMENWTDRRDGHSIGWSREGIQSINWECVSCGKASATSD
jgi:Zn ribbon nucleic-acid-binding protein